VVDQPDVGGADVRVAGRRWCDAHADGHGSFPEDGGESSRPALARKRYGTSITCTAVSIGVHRGNRLRARHGSPRLRLRNTAMMVRNWTATTRAKTSASAGRTYSQTPISARA